MTNIIKRFYYIDSLLRLSLQTDVTQVIKLGEYAKISQADRERLVLSETYDEELNTVLYSLHPVTTIYGKVEYAV